MARLKRSELRRERTSCLIERIGKVQTAQKTAKLKP